MADKLSPFELEKVRLVFDVYDFNGTGKIDCFNLGDALRAMNTNPTQGLVEKMGGTKKADEKFMTFEEFVPIMVEVKGLKDQGGYEDFLEGLKVYDKAENGTMMAAELAHVLGTLGEKLTDFEIMEIMKLAGEEDEDGYIKYEPFCKQLIAGPYPEENQ